LLISSPGPVPLSSVELDADRSDLELVAVALQDDAVIVVSLRMDDLSQI